MVKQLVLIALMTISLAATACTESAGPDQGEGGSEATPLSIEGPALALSIDGMMCVNGCGNQIVGMLQEVDGVRKVHLDFPKRQVHCELKDGAEAAEAVEAALRAKLKDSRFTITEIARP